MVSASRGRWSSTQHIVSTQHKKILETKNANEIMHLFSGPRSFVSSPSARSSVTLYGIFDDGIAWTSNQGGHRNVLVLNR
ncbi:hypothetical protein C8K18_12359 [Paraburkholderia sp. GV068]|nr:hypothetical protein C8K19_12359 [Paraburkholderia sp. GV072]PUA94317.1 hypothetical protein C8K18_12359 [Paraburkholderia sp. GV068]